MTVKQLIDVLSKFPPDMPVIVEDEGGYKELNEGYIYLAEEGDYVESTDKHVGYFTGGPKGIKYAVIG